MFQLNPPCPRAHSAHIKIQVKYPSPSPLHLGADPKGWQSKEPKPKLCFMIWKTSGLKHFFSGAKAQHDSTQPTPLPLPIIPTLPLAPYPSASFHIAATAAAALALH